MTSEWEPANSDRRQIAKNVPPLRNVAVWPVTLVGGASGDWIVTRTCRHEGEEQSMSNEKVDTDLERSKSEVDAVPRREFIQTSGTLAVAAASWWALHGEDRRPGPS